MGRLIKKITALLLSAAFVLSFAGCGSKDKTEDLAGRIHSAADCMVSYAGRGDVYLLDQLDLLPAGSTLSDWTAIAFHLAGIEDDYEGYEAALREYVSGCYEKRGYIDKVKSTEYQRIILTVLALGKDPRDFGTDGNGEPLDLLAEGTYDFKGSSLGRQGLNGWIFALIALDSKNYEVPDGARYTKEEIIDEIIAGQSEEGGLGLTKGSSEVDITAMAIQALSPYYETREDVKACVDRGLDWLSLQMSDNCKFGYTGVESSESSSQVIIALCSLGIDPEKDSRFCRGKGNVLEALEDFRRDDGGYAHDLSEGFSDYMATQQAMLALISAYRLKTGQPRIYDFSSEAVPIPRPETK